MFGGVRVGGGPRGEGEREEKREGLTQEEGKIRLK